MIGIFFENLARSVFLRVAMPSNFLSLMVQNVFSRRFTKPLSLLKFDLISSGSSSLTGVQYQYSSFFASSAQVFQKSSNGLIYLLQSSRRGNSSLVHSRSSCFLLIDFYLSLMTRSFSLRLSIQLLYSPQFLATYLSLNPSMFCLTSLSS